VETKVCSKCKVEKPIDEFYKRNRINRWGEIDRGCYCKKCFGLRIRKPPNRELNIEANRRYYWNHRKEILDKQKIRNKIDVENLDKKYIVKYIIAHSVLQPKDIPQELVEIKRLYLTLKRELKKCKQNHLTI
jgi:hypothetical protein